MANSCKWKNIAMVCTGVLGIVMILVGILLIRYSYTCEKKIIYTSENHTKEEIIVKPPPSYPHCVRDDVKGLQIVIRRYVILQITCNTTVPLENSPQDVSEGPEVQPALCPPSASTTGAASVNAAGSETRTTILVYSAVVLLLASLGAAFIEVWRARGLPDQVPPAGVPLTPSGSTGKTIAGAVREKPELSRRCSLADLTVLRHNRRESMMRRDSVMHMSIDNGTNGPPSSLHTRVPLKLLGTSKSQDDSRRSSIIAGPIGSLSTLGKGKWQRSFSADKADEPLLPEVVAHHRIHMIRHH